MSKHKFTSNGVTVEFDDNSDKIMAALENAVDRALHVIGDKAVDFAQTELRTPKQVTPGRTQDAVATSHLLQSIDYAVVGDDVYIGTNAEHGPYVEFGTGKYAENGGGRKGWWVYVIGGRHAPSSTMKIYTKEQAARIVAMLRSKGLDAHMTEGQMPRPYLRPAASEHSEEYREILEESMKNA